jgi:hypothetical protein
MLDARSRTLARTLLLSLAVSALCLHGCGDSDDETACPQPFGPPGSFGSAGEPPPLSTESKHVNEIGSKSHPEAESPPEAPSLRWDFSKPVVHAYDHVQTMESTMSLGMDMKLDAAGTVLLRSKGNDVAALVMKDMKMNMASKMGTGGEEQTMKSEPPVFVVPGVKEDGSMKTGNSSAEIFLQFLFPLPPKPLRVGESAAVPATMPFNAMGSVLSVEGTSTITLTKYVMIDGRRCARLETNIDVPEDLTGTYKCVTRGKSISYFDVERRRFVSVEVALVMGMQLDAPMPKIDMGGKEPPAVPSESMQMSMQMDTLIRLTLNPDKAAAEAKAKK